MNEVKQYNSATAITTAINSLISKGWTVFDATVV